MAQDRVERVFMVHGTDANGDVHVFATDDRDRAETRLRAMREQFGDVMTNWSLPISEDGR